jgi:outer membrane autotransporter protein
LAQVALGTFHERQGEQSLLTESGAVPAGWARTFGSHTRQRWSGDISPSFDGNIGGYQVGHDLFATVGDNGMRHHAGLFVSHARLKGDVRGFALGLEDRKAGDVRLDGDSLGAYWTLIGARAWYIDVVAMGTRFDGRSRSERGYTLDLDGDAITLSVEGGYPIALSPRWVIEPQAQVVAQKVDMDSARDPVSQVSFESQEYWRGRVGARLKGNYEVGGTPLEPYVRANLWRTFGGQDTVTFDGSTDLKSDHSASTAQIGAGLVSRLSNEVSMYVSADYSRNLDTQPQEALQGTLGLRISW